MYTILLNEDNYLKVTEKETIMQRSKLVDSLRFLVFPIYKEKDMSSFTVMLEYLTPISKKYKSEILNLSDEKYLDYLQYVMPIDTDLTAEPGDVELQLTFVSIELDSEGTGIQYVRKTSPTILHITPIAAWSDIVPDEALNAVDQKLLKIEALNKELSELSNSINNNKADNIVLTEEGLQLTSNGNAIGDVVSMQKIADGVIENNEEGIVKIVEF